MFDGKLKAVTFSFDDGVTQDKRLIEIFNKYGLKSTFNLNSGKLGLAGQWTCAGVLINHIKFTAEELPEIYAGHEVASHTVTHAGISKMADADILHQVNDDVDTLSSIMGYPVVGFAYPGVGGCPLVTDELREFIRNNTKVQYARVCEATHNFDLQDDLYNFKPTCHNDDSKLLFELAHKFIDMKPDKPQLFYVMGHAYSFDAHDSWDTFEEFCKLISGHDDTFYGTNKQCLLDE